MNDITYNSKFNIVDYVELVNELAEEYFDEQGNYTPQIGKINAIRLFYNRCVKMDLHELPHDIVEIADVDKLIQDNAFMKTFNTAIKNKADVSLDFAGAYLDAQEIVNNKNNSLNQAATKVGNILYSTIQVISKAMDDGKLNKIADAINTLSGGAVDEVKLAM